eukprot:766406-Hanusia_phi.AAC.1
MKESPTQHARHKLREPPVLEPFSTQRPPCCLSKEASGCSYHVIAFSTITPSRACSKLLGQQTF